MEITRMYTTRKGRWRIRFKPEEGEIFEVTLGSKKWHEAQLSPSVVDAVRSLVRNNLQALVDEAHAVGIEIHNPASEN